MGSTEIVHPLGSSLTTISGVFTESGSKKGKGPASGVDKNHLTPGSKVRLGQLVEDHREASDDSNNHRLQPGHW